MFYSTVTTVTIDFVFVIFRTCILVFKLFVSLIGWGEKEIILLLKIKRSSNCLEIIMEILKFMELFDSKLREYFVIN